MKTRAIAVVFAGLLLALKMDTGLTGAEHPEHPHGDGAKEHPQESKSADTQKAFQDSFENDVKNHVQTEASKTGGVFTVKDDALNKVWKLRLVKVHKNKICMLDQGRTCFACADFKEVNGRNKIDLDFYADHAPDGAVAIKKVLIHKVNGIPRFTYDKDNNRVPLKK